MDQSKLEHAEYLGTSHLIATQSLVHYNNYVFKLATRRFPERGEFMEFGPGFGDFTGRFLAEGAKIDVVEIEPQFHPVLATTFAHKVASSSTSSRGRTTRF